MPAGSSTATCRRSCESAQNASWRKARRGYREDARALLYAHAAFLRGGNASQEAGGLVPVGPGRTVAHALASRVHQYGRAFNMLLERGYVAEAGPTLRAMASAAVSLLYMADRDERPSPGVHRRWRGLSVS